jgi:hypothetical protein
LIATTANDTDLWLAQRLSRAKAVESAVESLWATCAAAAYRLCVPRHKILGCAVNEIFRIWPDIHHNVTGENLVTCCFIKGKKTRKLGPAILDGYVARH